MRNFALMWVLAGVAVALLAAGDGKPTVSTFTDKRDGKVYKIVKIGSQTWFAENLNYAAEESVCYEDKDANCATYGRLYDWETALKACPAGTHLPTDDEWKTLTDYIGGYGTAGKKLKSTSGWDYKGESGNGTNEYGFSALPGGTGYSLGRFRYAGYGCFWWSATELTAYYTWYRYTVYDTETVYRNFGNKSKLYSVRCVQDDENEKSCVGVGVGGVFVGLRG